MGRMSRLVRRTVCRCSSARISSGYGGEGGVQRIDITHTLYAAPQSDYTPSDRCSGEFLNVLYTE